MNSRENEAESEEEFAIAVVEKLREAGFETLFAGGCVRDLLMGNPPKDYDVATAATPQQVRELFGKKRTLAVGAAFGVMIVLAPKKLGGQVEVATFRTDASYSDGRRPDSVTFSTPEEDAQRRDFTINGMFYDPIEERVIDFVEGQRDLEKKVIRAIGNPADRIAEDKLRMLRAVRFAARFGFEMEAATRSAIAATAQDVAVVSGERISVEVQKTLQTPNAVWAISELHELGLLPFIFPEAIDAWSQNRSSVHEVIAALPQEAWRLKISALMLAANIQENQWETVKVRLKLANADLACIRFSSSGQTLLDESEQMPWSRLQPLVVNRDWEACLELFRTRCKVANQKDRLLELEARVELVDELNPAPLILGEDLIKLGMRPGPEFKELLQQVRNRQLDGQLRKSKDALDWVQSTKS